MRPSPRHLQWTVKPSLPTSTSSQKAIVNRQPLRWRLQQQQQQPQQRNTTKQLPSHYNIASFFNDKLSSNDRTATSDRASSHDRSVKDSGRGSDHSSQLWFMNVRENNNGSGMDYVPWQTCGNHVMSHLEVLLNSDDPKWISLEDASRDTPCPLVIFARTTSERFYEVANSGKWIKQRQQQQQQEEEEGTTPSSATTTTTTRKGHERPPPFIIMGKNAKYIDFNRLREGTTILKLPDLLPRLLQSERKSFKRGNNKASPPLAELLGLNSRVARRNGDPARRGAWKGVGVGVAAGGDMDVDSDVLNIPIGDSALDQLFDAYEVKDKEEVEEEETYFYDNDGEEDDGRNVTTQSESEVQSSPMPNYPLPLLLQNAPPTTTRQEAAIMLWTRDRLIEEFYPGAMSIARTSNYASSNNEWIYFLNPSDSGGSSSSNIAGTGVQRAVPGREGTTLAPLNRYVDAVRKWREKDFRPYSPPDFQDYPSRGYIPQEEEVDVDNRGDIVAKDEDLGVCRWLARFTQTMGNGVSVKIFRRSGTWKRNTTTSLEENDAGGGGSNENTRDIDLLFRIGSKAKETWALRVLAGQLLEAFPEIKVEVVYDE